MCMARPMPLPGLAPTPARAASLYQADEGETTPTPSLTAEASETPLPTGTPTPLATADVITATQELPTATPTLPVTATLTLTPTLPAPIATATPTFVPTAAVPATTPASPITFTLYTDPPRYIPGDPLQIVWEVHNLPADRSDLEIEVSVPPAFTPAADLISSFNPATHTLIMPVASEVNATNWGILADAQGTYTIRAGLHLAGNEIFTATLTLSEDGFNVVPAAGGEARGLYDRVRVSFPEGAAGEDLTVRVRHPSLVARPPQSLSGQPFEILAVGQKSGQEVHKFDQPLTIEVSYDKNELYGQNEAWLRLYYYNDDQSVWLPLASQVYSNSNLLPRHHRPPDRLRYLQQRLGVGPPAQLATLPGQPVYRSGHLLPAVVDAARTGCAATQPEPELQQPDGG